MAGDFTTSKLGNGIRLHVRPTEKFKTVVVDLFIHQNLTPEDATRTALLPMVLRRGCRSLPTALDLTRKLDGLYGAEIRTEILKKGERQLVSFVLEMVNDRFLPSREGLLRQGLEVLACVVSDPAVDGDGFRGDYVEQEKVNLRRQIEGLLNDKRQYAVARCIQEMCRDENFGIYKYGRVEDIVGIERTGLYDYYRSLLRENPADLFVVGDVDPAEIREAAENAFGFSRSGGREVKVGPVEHPVSRVRTVVERQDVTQGKLTLGLRTNISRRSAGFYPLAVANGILGGYAHSKLFQNVREKASLAYYAYSNLEVTKGLMIIGAGIEFANYELALEIITKQIDELKAGKITEYEFDATKKAMVKDVRVAADNPPQEISLYLDGLINDRVESAEEKISAIRRVTREDVIRAAGRIELDTVYFLRNREGGTK